MFNKRNLQHIIIVIFTFIGLNLMLENKGIAQNSSAYNDVRNLTTNNCDYDPNEDQATKRTTPCYVSTYNNADGDDRCNLPSFKFDPFGHNDDLDWNYGNDTCLGYMLGAGASLQAAFVGCRFSCPTPPSSAVAPTATQTAQAGAQATQQTSRLANIYESATKAARVANRYAKQASNGAGSPGVSMLSGMPIDPFSIIELGIYTARCFIPTQAAGCCPAAIACTVALGTAIGVLGGIFETAKDHFYSVGICGEGWKKWQQKDLNSKWEIADGNYEACLKEVFGIQPSSPTLTRDKYCTIGRKTKSQVRYCEFTQNNDSCSRAAILFIENKLTATISGTDKGRKEIKNIHYREYIFGGIEYEDNGNDSCKNPKDTGTSKVWEGLLGYDTSKEENQKYYFKGPNQMPNFACKRFIQRGSKDLEGLKAFTCCNNRSQKTTCIERVDSKMDKHKLCSLGGNCGDVFAKDGSLIVKYKIFESERNPKYICAKSYSVCPYDHNVSAGTDYAENYYYNPKIITNFCQYMNHCTKIPPISKYSYFDSDTFFFSESCSDLKGDSQFINTPGVSKYPSSDISSIYSRNFSAPIVQCLKETLENNFLQKTGKTICKDQGEKAVKSKLYPNGKCQSGYLYQKGEIKDQTFFQKVQNRFKVPIKIAFVLSVVMMGFNILLASPETFISKKIIMTYLLKFGLIYFFVLSNAWQGFFLDSVMNLSTEFANITFRPKATKDTALGDDGCSFPKYNYLKLLEYSSEDPSSSSAVKTSEVIANPLYPDGKNYLRIWDTLDCKIARALGYGAEASLPNLAKMIFAGFLTGGMGITFFFASFIYGFTLISIVIRAIHITIMSIIAIILLIYVSPLTITCALFERTKGIFENWWKQMLGFILQPMILFAYLGLLLTVFDSLFIGTAKFKPATSTQSMPEIDCSEYDGIKPDDTSIYCILNFAKFKNFNGLEAFDLAIPVLTSMNKEKINTLFRAAIIMFVLLNFLDKITSVAKKLVGGAELDHKSTLDLKKKVEGVTRGLQTRALNSTTRLATKQIPNAVRNKIRNSGSKQPESSDNKKDNNKPSDSAGGSSTSGGSDSSGGN